MSNSQTTTASGGCLCGAVRYRIEAGADAPLRNVVNCHCEQCRRTSGHVVAASSVAADALTLLNDDGLRWYQSSDAARRGFCANCGSSLFWEPIGGDHVAIMAGTIDSPTGLVTEQHIFTDFAGDYYSLNDGLPQRGGDG